LTYTTNDPRKRKSYDGEWKDGKRNGKGEMVWKNGARYNGDWSNGKRDGYGEHIFPNGEKYVGNWKNGRREGRTIRALCISFLSDIGIVGTGIRVFSNGDQFEGTWKNDKKEGSGVYICAHGRRTNQLWEGGKQKTDEPLQQGIIKKENVLCVIMTIANQ